MKFIRLVRVHTWVNPIFFGNNWSNRTTDMGKVCPKTGFLAFIQPVWIFLTKNFQSRNRYPISHRKGYIHFCRPDTPFSEKWSCPPKNFFHGYFGFFFLNYYIKNISNLIFYKNVYIDFCCQTPPSPQNGHVFPQMVFHNFFNIHWRTSAKFSSLKVYSFERKLYGE